MQRQEHLCNSQFFELNHTDSMVLFLTQKSFAHNFFVDVQAPKASGRTILWISLQENSRGKIWAVIKALCFKTGIWLSHFHFVVCTYDVIPSKWAFANYVICTFAKDNNGVISFFIVLISINTHEVETHKCLFSTFRGYFCLFYCNVRLLSKATLFQLFLMDFWKQLGPLAVM